MGEILEAWLADLNADHFNFQPEPSSAGYREAARFARDWHLESTTLPDLAFDADEVPHSGNPNRGNSWHQTKGPELSLRPFR